MPIRRNVKVRALLVGMGVSIGARGAVASDRLPAFIIFENFQWTKPHVNGVSNRLSWIYGEAQLSKDFKVVGSYLDIPIRNVGMLRTLDEAFGELTIGDKVIRAGRFRPRFGFGDWSELAYVPIIAQPMARTQAMNGLALQRFDTGLDVQGNIGDAQYQVGLVDTANDNWVLAPNHLDHAIGRLQLMIGDLMLGFNGLTRLNRGAQRDTIGGLDFRWTCPQWQVRGELVKGFDRGGNGEGAYIDVFFRPPGWFHTQLGARTEFFRNAAGKRFHLNVVGIRQTLNKELVLTANYGWGSQAGPPAGSRGLIVQVMTAVRF